LEMHSNNGFRAEFRPVGKSPNEYESDLQIKYSSVLIW
jgi:hypothetical protein